jgi:hypothetical protein
MLATGAVGVGVGTIWGVLAIVVQGKLNTACNAGKQCPATEQSDIDAMHGDALVSTIGFGVGLAAAAVGSYVLFFGPSSKKTGKLEVTPWIGPASVGLSGRFQ